MAIDRRTLLLGGAGLGILAGLGSSSSPPKKSIRRQQCNPYGPMPCHQDGSPAHLIKAPQRALDLPVGAYTGVVLDLPYEMRTKNWGGGSCVHASNVNLLKWMGLHEMAEWWRNNYSGGEYDGRLIKRMEAAGLKYAYAYDDPNFFYWCTRTRRGAGIFYKPSHSINFVGMSYPNPNYNNYTGAAYLLDNNYTSYPEVHGHYEIVEWNRFIQQWRGFGGFAWTLIYDPPPGEPVYAG